MNKRLSKRVNQKKEHTRKILAVFSDTHGGDAKGLLNPETTFLVDTPVEGEDGVTRNEIVPTPVSTNPYQKWMWGVYQKNIAATFDLADGDDVAVVHNGDISQGWKYQHEGVMDATSQNFIATANMLPWFEHQNVKWFRLVYGTSSHENKAPEHVYNVLKKDFPDVDIQIAKHLQLQFAGLMFDIAHHGAGPGGRNWLEGNQVRYYTKSMCADYMDGGQRPPDAVIRSHFHTKVEEWVVKFYKQWGRVRTLSLITPSYQGMNEFGRQVTRSRGTVVNGHIAIEIIDNAIHDVYWFTSEVDQRTYEVIE